MPSSLANRFFAASTALSGVRANRMMIELAAAEKFVVPGNFIDETHAIARHLSPSRFCTEIIVFSSLPLPDLNQFSAPMVLRVERGNAAKSVDAATSANSCSLVHINALLSASATKAMLLPQLHANGPHCRLDSLPSRGDMRGWRQNLLQSGLT
jgi:hypothetical protein